MYVQFGTQRLCLPSDCSCRYVSVIFLNMSLHWWRIPYAKVGKRLTVNVYWRLNHSQPEWLYHTQYALSKRPYIPQNVWQIPMYVVVAEHLECPMSSVSTKSDRMFIERMLARWHYKDPYSWLSSRELCLTQLGMCVSSVNLEPETLCPWDMYRRDDTTTDCHAQIGRRYMACRLSRMHRNHGLSSQLL